MVALNEVEELVVEGLVSVNDNVPDCCANPGTARLTTSKAARKRYRINHLAVSS
jgi:hypothetical protein